MLMAKRKGNNNGGSKPHLRTSIIPKKGSQPDIPVLTVETAPYDGPSAYAVRVISSMARGDAGDVYTVIDMMGYARNGYTPEADGSVAPAVRTQFERKVLAELTKAKLVTRTTTDEGEVAYALADRAHQFAVGRRGEGLLKNMEPGKAYGIPELQRLGDGGRMSPHALYVEFIGDAKTAGLIEQTHTRPPAYTRLEARVQTFLR
jgi:hypothetical protein